MAVDDDCEERAWCELCEAATPHRGEECLECCTTGSQPREVHGE